MNHKLPENHPLFESNSKSLGSPLLSGMTCNMAVSADTKNDAVNVPNHIG